MLDILFVFLQYRFHENLYKDLNSISDNTEKLTFLLDPETKKDHPNLEDDMKGYEFFCESRYSAKKPKGSEV